MRFCVIFQVCNQYSASQLVFFFNKSDGLCFYAAVVFGIISFTAFYFLKCKIAFHFFGNL